VPEHIANLLNVVRRLHSRIFRAQENIIELEKMIYSWALSPVLMRKQLKDENLLDLDEREENFQKRYKQIEQVVTELDRILDENYKLFFDLLPDWVYEKNEFKLKESNFYFSLIFEKNPENFGMSYQGSFVTYNL